MKHIPHIDSLGLPPERHAERIVGEMLTHLAKKQQSRRAAIPIKPVKEALWAGNPKAQARLVERLCRDKGPALIDIELTSGKRGHYQIVFHEWSVWDDSRDGDEIRPGDVIPEPGWLMLACSRNVIMGVGNGKHDYRGANVLFIRHHALVRAAMRCNARTVADMMQVAKALWQAYSAYRMTREAYSDTPDGTRLAVALPGTMEPCTAVLRWSGRRLLTVTTLLGS